VRGVLEGQVSQLIRIVSSRSKPSETFSKESRVEQMAKRTRRDCKVVRIFFFLSCTRLVSKCRSLDEFGMRMRLDEFGRVKRLGETSCVSGLTEMCERFD
jgi:hypothetical protein